MRIRGNSSHPFGRDLINLNGREKPSAPRRGDRLPEAPQGPKNGCKLSFSRRLAALKKTGRRTAWRKAINGSDRAKKDADQRGNAQPMAARYNPPRAGESFAVS